MSDVKTMVFPEMGGNSALETALLANNGGMNGGMWNNPLWAIVFLAALQNGGIFGGGHNGGIGSVQEQLNTNHGQTLLMDAIKGNASAVHELASTINCDFNSVQAAINSVQTAISNVGNQVGMTGAQTINAIQNGNMMLANTLQSCCCDVRQDVTKMGYENQVNNLQQSNMISKGFCDVAYATQAQTNALAQNADANTRAVLAKIDAVEDSRKDREIAALTAALTAANSRAERASELAPILQQLSDIKCHQPQTVTLPYSCATAIPTQTAWQLYGGYGLNANGGFL